MDGYSEQTDTKRRPGPGLSVTRFSNSSCECDELSLNLRSYKSYDTTALLLLHVPYVEFTNYC